METKTFKPQLSTFEKALAVILVLLPFVLGLFYFDYIFDFEPSPRISSFIKNLGVAKSQESQEDFIEEEKESVFKPLLAPVYVDPTKVIIEDVNISVSLAEVGVEPSGQLETPASWNEGGWFYKSAKPGEPGNMIVNAHYDSSGGAPAAFWELKNVEVDDTVRVLDKLGRTHFYKVSELFYININDPDRLQILDQNEDKSELTLITCGGVYLPGSGYDKRLVVKANLVEQSD